MCIIFIFYKTRQDMKCNILVCDGVHKGDVRPPYPNKQVLNRSHSNIQTHRLAMVF